MKPIDIETIRVKNEKKILYISLTLFLVILFLILGISFGVAIIIYLILFVYAVVVIKIRQGQLLGNGIKVTKDQFPKVYKLAELSAQRINLIIPDIFIVQNPVINAFAIGFFGNKSVVLNSATVNAMTEEELLSIISHEFTHIKAGHTKWIVLTGTAEGIINIPIISSIFRFVLMFWSRKAEYTCDRGSLIGCQDPNAAVRALIKVAVGKELFDRINIDNIFNQKDNIDNDQFSRLAESFSDHPYIIKRIHIIIDFYNSEIYNNIVNS